MSSKVVILIIALAVACGSIMLPLAGWGLSGVIEWSRPTRAHSKEQLLTELNRIQLPPGAMAIHGDTVILKSTHALVGRAYSFNGTYEEIRAHYDAELRSKGWHFIEERKLKSWSEDLGERDLNYCKEGMWAEVFFRGNLAADGGSAYHLNVSSGLNECK
jgi:hypothetical protein